MHVQSGTQLGSEGISPGSLEVMLARERTRNVLFLIMSQIVNLLYSSSAVSV